MSGLGDRPYRRKAFARLGWRTGRNYAWRDPGKNWEISVGRGIYRYLVSTSQMRSVPQLTSCAGTRSSAA
jgi:hypothetical protein